MTLGVSFMTKECFIMCASYHIFTIHALPFKYSLFASGVRETSEAITKPQLAAPQDGRAAEDAFHSQIGMCSSQRDNHLLTLSYSFAEKISFRDASSARQLSC